MRCRAGGGPLTVRLSELSLMELQRLAALAGAQWSAAPPAADQPPANPVPDRACGDGRRDTQAHAPIMLVNYCPVALEIGQVIKHQLPPCMESKATSSKPSLSRRSSLMQQGACLGVVPVLAHYSRYVACIIGHQAQAVRHPLSSGYRRANLQEDSSAIRVQVPHRWAPMRPSCCRRAHVCRMSGGRTRRCCPARAGSCACAVWARAASSAPWAVPWTQAWLLPELCYRCAITAPPCSSDALHVQIMSRRWWRPC